MNAGLRLQSQIIYIPTFQWSRAVFLYLTNMFNAHNRLQIILFIFLRTFKDQKIFSALLLFAVGNMKGFIYACSYVCVT